MRNKHIHAARIGSALVAAWLLTMAAICLNGCSTPKPQTPEEKIQASTDDLRATLESAVEDAGKRQQMQALADQALAELQAGAAELATLRQEQERLNADYNATKDDYKKLEERQLAVRQKQIAQMIATRQALANMATDDEWKKITSRDMALLSH